MSQPTVDAAAYPVPGPRVHDIPAERRPRERFDQVGAEHVEVQVLLAIILRSGVKGMSVVSLADQLMAKYGSLSRIAQQSVSELAGFKGMGRVKAQVLKAALELAQRMNAETTDKHAAIRKPEEAARILRPKVHALDREVFWVLLLDAKNRLKQPPQPITSGLADASLVHAREVFKEAIRSASVSVILAHNHPSGDPTPSEEDLTITRQLVEAGHLIGINVLDHVILGQRATDGDNDFASIRELGLVEFGSASR